jgi:hypothetical protein
MSDRITWDSLMRLEPKVLHRYLADAYSIAQRAEWNWYLKWLPRFSALLHDCKGIAKRHGLDMDEVHSIVTRHLIHEYKQERQAIRR